MKELHLKYRPKTLDELVGQPSVVKTLKEMIKNKRVPHSIMLAGPTGCGKTTTARILKKHLNCHDMDFQEINCADFRGIDMVRDIRMNMGLSPFGENGSRIYLIDECQQLSSPAFGAFLKLLEDTPQHVYFLFCTTDPNKIPATVKNRCTVLAFKLLSSKEMLSLLQKTAESENVEVTEDVFERIIEVAEGSARQGMNILNRVIKLESELDAVLKSNSKHAAIEIARALIETRTKWGDISKIIKGVEEEPESLRHLILAYATTILLSGGPKSDRAYSILLAFESNWYDSKRAGLVRACYEVISSK